MQWTGAMSSADDVEDGDLWGRAARDDAGAFGVLFERHVQAVWNHAYRLTGSWSAAEDLTSNTFLIAWRKRAEVVLVRDSLRPWLYTVAGNLARTERRGASRRLRLLRRIPEPDVVSDHADAVADQLDGEARLKQVIDAVRTLPRAQRQVVELCLLGDLSIADAAALLKVAEVTVRSHLSRAKAQLRDLVEEK
ncbi:RNA polymerase, sigma subunit, ECF family [Saccharopolyspora shandongensis]|uniref:RNA polymerase, sigma subunit, ECF family n=1 Tax=Saccharopolyspora shandongensis TaxID=418495 RepID=A0A1H3NNP5_9PSEU|nr:RNA polymerase sigma factor [Saccharopolyspora shandongensis]SDY90035.1 RNA polymerase, sigma subunit, ECF family [Saccharopolyspora shandongensis]